MILVLRPSLHAWVVTVEAPSVAVGRSGRATAKGPAPTRAPKKDRAAFRLLAEITYQRETAALFETTRKPLRKTARVTTPLNEGTGAE